MSSYQVPTKALNQAVRRNQDRFPSDFMFHLTKEEATALRSQFVTLDAGRGRYSKNKELAERIEKLEAGQQEHASVIGILADEIDELKRLPEPPKRPIGFRPEEK